MIKLAFFTIALFFTVSKVFTQNLAEIIPAESKRDDILRILKDKKVEILSDGSIQYDLPNRLINFKFYNGSCSELEQKQLGLSSETLIQIKDSPKLEFSAKEILGIDFDDYVEALKSSDQFTYINSAVGISVVEKTFGEKRAVTLIFYFPKPAKLPNCLIKELDTNIQQALEISKTKRPPAQDNDYLLLHTYLSNSKIYWNKSDLDYFADFLKDSINRKGYVIVYAGKTSKQNEAQIWIKRLENYLFKEKKIDKNRISFIDGGYREDAIAQLFVLKKDDIAPKPTPTILPSQVKIIKNRRIRR
ncbi:MAG TPA: hypothetical protein PKE69_17735 [Pyrinomonadaceae bacterium]|nr:hypothetical protein [Pyrinomonadaceae bacterium]